MREKRDLYNENLELTGKTYFKGDNIPDGYFPMVVNDSHSKFKRRIFDAKTS